MAIDIISRTTPLITEVLQFIAWCGFNYSKTTFYVRSTNISLYVLTYKLGVNLP
jgi:tryptophanyl-tRNA synthetase